MTDTATTPSANPAAPARRRSAPKGAGLDVWFEYACFAAATTVLAALGGVLVVLTFYGWPAFQTFGLNFFTSSTWDPVKNIYGGAGPIVGTLITAGLALLFSLPVAGGVAFFLVEFCPQVLRRPIGTAVELLAGIPSIVYGMWGYLVFAPAFAAHVEAPVQALAANSPGSFLDVITQGVPDGYGILAASIILAIMILPFTAATLRELLLTVPAQVRESAYGLGATTFEVVTTVTLPYVRRGAIGAVMLGLGRALGETMAVTFIIGNAHGFPKSLFDSGSTIASTIASEFSEAHDPIYAASLIALGLILFLITFTVLALARLMLRTQVRA
ncbi:MAG: phosphate ABC transporter permease subunit PstC [Caulobacterales bacterium]